MWGLSSSFLLKASRPGLWFPTVWLYLLPLSGSTSYQRVAFWVGLFFVTFPLNLLVYGWNDLVDTETDRLNPRKDSYLFGARGTDAQLQSLPTVILLTQISTWPAVIYFGGIQALATLAGIVLFCWVYNHPHWGWRARPPLELFCQVGYLLVLPVSWSLNNVEIPSPETFLYLSLFCLQSQLIGEVMDIAPDTEAGRRTVATELGRMKTKSFIIVVVAGEIAMLLFVFQEVLFAGSLGLFILWLIIDYIVIKDKEYTPLQFRLFGLGSNLAALFSMAYIWQNKIFA